MELFNIGHLLALALSDTTAFGMNVVRVGSPKQLFSRCGVTAVGHGNRTRCARTC